MLKFLRHAPVVVVGGLLIFSACQNKPDNVAPIAVAPAIPGEMLDYLEESGETLRDVLPRIEAIESVSIAAINRRENRERELKQTIAEFSAYDAEVWSLFDQFILAKSYELFRESDDIARQNNQTIEWALQSKATHITDQLWELSHRTQGNISMQDGPRRDQFSDALTDAMAMSALLGQIMSGETPFYAQVNSNELLSASKSLSEGLYTAAALNITLRSASQIPQVQPVDDGIQRHEAGVQNVSD